jgi:heme/copper-type cytochrome/quinol oxidase subunit 3
VVDNETPRNSYSIFGGHSTVCALLEYFNAPFNISDGVYGSCFYMTTGFHGFHVFIGTIALMVPFCEQTPISNWNQPFGIDFSTHQFVLTG